ncbi:MAG: hypothetical protein KDK53_21185 [Maritimibacter sp.]|nr:hypothetical protein [Maritimibacter sp.]
MQFEQSGVEVSEQFMLSQKRYVGVSKNIAQQRKPKERMKLGFGVRET